MDKRRSEGSSRERSRTNTTGYLISEHIIIYSPSKNLEKEIPSDSTVVIRYVRTKLESEDRTLKFYWLDCTINKD